jgi:hypothetical protein
MSHPYALILPGSKHEDELLQPQGQSRPLTKPRPHTIVACHNCRAKKVSVSNFRVALLRGAVP